MSLRRTALARRTELRRTPLKVRAARRITRPRSNTGPTIVQRNLVVDRAAGCCELCGVLLHDGYGWIDPHSLHHRLPRGMGGTALPTANSPANLLLVCGTGTTGCHGLIESFREASYTHGWLVKRGQDPADVVVLLPVGDARVLLTHDGTYEAAA